MDMKLPYRRHLDWLVLEGNKAEEVRVFYDNIQLPHPTDDVLQAAEDRVQALGLPPGIQKRIAKKRYNKADHLLLNKLGFGEMYAKRMERNDVDWSGVGRLLSHPVMRVALDCALLARLKPDELCAMLPDSFGLTLTPYDIDLYTSYFFDFKSMDLSDWRAYLSLVAEDHYTYIRLHAALTKTQDDVLYLIGLPTKMQFSAFLKNVLATSDYKFRHYSRQNTPEGDGEARKWSKVGIEAGEKFEKFAASDATDFAKLIQTDFDYISGELPTIAPEMVADIKPQLALSGADEKKVSAPSLVAEANAPDIANQNAANRL
jgi:hypothetical protein